MAKFSRVLLENLIMDNTHDFEGFQGAFLIEAEDINEGSLSEYQKAIIKDMAKQIFHLSISWLNFYVILTMEGSLFDLRVRDLKELWYGPDRMGLKAGSFPSPKVMYDIPEDKNRCACPYEGSERGPGLYCCMCGVPKWHSYWTECHDGMKFVYYQSPEPDN